MPELPEVETIRLGLAPVLKGRRFSRVTARRADLRLPLPAGFEGRLEGRQVLALDRRGKFLLFRLEGGIVLIVHLGMSGRLKLFEGQAPPPETHDHVAFEMDSGAHLRFHDPRRFGLMALAGEAGLFDHPLLAGLGPEPLEEGFDGARLAARLAGKATAIKAALLDQRVLAGLGNIYASEALFRAGLSPKRRASTVQGERARRLAGAIRAVLGEAIRAGGSSLRDHRLPSGELGYFQHRFSVYGRAGARCPGCDCDPARTGGIRVIRQHGRATFYCTRRQR